jgi:hypothetical protein
LTKITAYYEKQLRQEAKTNSCMKYLNVGMVGLRGKHHPAINNIVTPMEVQKMRPHLKMLCANLLSSANLGQDHHTADCVLRTQKHCPI